MLIVEENILVKIITFKFPYKIIILWILIVEKNKNDIKLSMKFIRAITADKFHG